MKSFKKFFSVLFICLILSLTLSSDFISCYNVKASGGIIDYIDALTNYFLTVTGAVNKPSQHTTSDHIDISPVPSTSRNAIKQKIIDLINNNGIYESNGQYIFTSSAMDELYYILNGNSSVDYRVVNDFSRFTFLDPDGYASTTYLNNINNLLNIINNDEYSYLICCSISSNTDGDVSFYVDAYRVPSNAYYLCYYNTNLYFANSSGSLISGTLKYYLRSRYRRMQNSYSETGVDTSTYSYIDHIDNNFYNSFPYVINSSGLITDNFYCDSSILLSTSIVGANSANTNNGIIYFNNFNNITVDNSVINNNDWSSVYNSYVTNVNNTYNTEVTNNNGNDLTIKELRQIMTTYLTPIYNAIEDGLTDIAEKVDYINEWLSKIYSNGSLIITRLDSIIQIIQQNTGGSGSTSGTACAWSEQEVDIVLDKLSRIYTEQVDNDLDVIAALEYIKTKINSLDTTLSTASSNISTISSNTSSIVTSLDTELSRLATVLTKMDTIISKMGQNRITQPTIDPNIIDDLEDLLPESVLDDIFSPFAALGSIIETVVPFCYIGVAVAIMSNLSAEAEAPYWEIPFKYDSDALALHIDEKLIIDLSPFEDLSTILRLLFIIAFTISLMFFSLPLVNYMTGIFSGK